MRMWHWKDNRKYQVRPDGDRSLSLSLYSLVTRVTLYRRERMGNISFMVQWKEGETAS